MDDNRTTPRSARAALEPERMPAPKRRSRRARHPVVIVGNAIFTLVLFLVLALGAVVYWGNQRFEQPGPLTEDKIVNIPRGLGVRDIAELLAREGVIRDPWIFVGGAAAMKARGADLKFGEYQFAKGASARQVAETLVEGKVVQHLITIAEGLTSEQIVARLLENDKLTGTVREVPREGSLLPDGYRFTRGTTRDDMIKRMQAAQARVLQDAWERRAPELPVKSPEQLLILASIVEKETGKAEERTRVAAVFVNRLNRKMKLQSDPTIIYGLVGGKGSLGRGILKSEITQPTPYNTYVIEGLPPGPIANPGRASIEAVANPARTKELFFVADGTGGHAFSETYEQHQKHVAKLRGLEKEARDAADAAANGAPGNTASASNAPANAAAPVAQKPGAGAGGVAKRPAATQTGARNPPKGGT
ncbi:endolytic transglycosylase MltG, partial [Pseudorhodoplanes sp.]|uniref:endolytic transglycosylase MltG n=1 Tax=Pseudorhodoplanes sp. TaxID=1934341 RepID=UPI00391A6F41